MAAGRNSGGSFRPYSGGGNPRGGGYSVGKNMTAKSKPAAAAQTKAAKTYMNPTGKKGNADALKNWRLQMDADIYSAGQKSGVKAGIVKGLATAGALSVASNRTKPKPKQVPTAVQKNNIKKENAMTGKKALPKKTVKKK